MQDIKQRVALTSIATSGGFTLAKGAIGPNHRVACDTVGRRAFAARSRRHHHDLFRSARVRPADAEQGGQRGTQSHFWNCAPTSSPRPDYRGPFEQTRASAPASECQQWLS